MQLVKDFVTILKGVAFREFCSLNFYENGLRLTVDDETEVQVNAYFKPAFFTAYHLNSPNSSLVSICVKSKVILQAMGMFQDPTAAAHIIYRAYGEPLEIQMETGSTKSQVRVPTNEVPEALNITYDAVSLPVKILFSPNFLRELLADIDHSCRTVKFDFFTDKLHIETKGDVYQLTKVQVCDENREDFLVINAVDGGVVVCYRSDNIRKILPLLKTAFRVAFRVDVNGVLCIQVLIEHEESLITFIDFLMYSSVLDETTLDDSRLLDQTSQPFGDES